VGTNIEIDGNGDIRRQGLPVFIVNQRAANAEQQASRRITRQTVAEVNDFFAVWTEHHVYL